MLFEKNMKINKNNCYHNISSFSKMQELKIDPITKKWMLNICDMFKLFYMDNYAYSDSKAVTVYLLIYIYCY